MQKQFNHPRENYTKNDIYSRKFLKSALQLKLEN